MAEPYDQREARYLRFKKKNPGVSFAQYLTERHFRNLSNNEGRNSTGALAVVDAIDRAVNRRCIVAGQECDHVRHVEGLHHAAW